MVANKKNIKEQFDDDGYVALYSFFDDNKIQEIKNELSRYINTIAPTLPNHHVFYEDKLDKSTIKNLQQMFTYDNYFKELIEESKIQEIASSILGKRQFQKIYNILINQQGLVNQHPLIKMGIILC